MARRSCESISGCHRRLFLLLFSCISAHLSIKDSHFQRHNVVGSGKHIKDELSLFGSHQKFKFLFHRYRGVMNALMTVENGRTALLLCSVLMGLRDLAAALNL